MKDYCDCFPPVPCQALMVSKINWQHVKTNYPINSCTSPKCPEERTLTLPRFTLHCISLYLICHLYLLCIFFSYIHCYPCVSGSSELTCKLILRFLSLVVNVLPTIIKVSSSLKIIILSSYTKISFCTLISCLHFILW